MSITLDPDQTRRIVWPDLGPNCLPRLSADDTGGQRVKLWSHSQVCQEGKSPKNIEEMLHDQLFMTDIRGAIQKFVDKLNIFFIYNQIQMKTSHLKHLHIVH